MIQLVQQARFQSRPASQTLMEREVCWNRKLQSNRDMDELRSRNAWKPRTFTLDDKKARLAESINAEEAFQNAAERAERAMNSFQERRDIMAGSIMVRLGRFHSEAGEAMAGSK